MTIVLCVIFEPVCVSVCLAVPAVVRVLPWSCYVVCDSLLCVSRSCCIVCLAVLAGWQCVSCTLLT